MASLIFVCHLYSVDKPNVVYILLDDAGYGDLSCYGQKKFQTPNIDRLASEGMKFTQHYSGSTVCAPTRCVLMTGKHPGHAWVRTNKATKPIGQEPIPDSEVTVAELLKKQGYATGAFGKWGLGQPGSTGDPLKQGFDRFFGYNCQGRAHSYYSDYLQDDDKHFALKNNPPIPGPTMKPRPKAIPTIASPLERFSRVVLSATAAVATERLPPIAPPSMRASTSIQKDAAKNHAA